MANNTSESDYERQFQADLEKAAALSLETLALDEFKRKQRNGLAYQRNSINADQLRSMQVKQQQHQDQQQRRKSEILPSPTSAAPDLISFSGPEESPTPQPSTSSTTAASAAASAANPIADRHTSFVQYVDQIHQINAQQQQYLASRPSPFAAHASAAAPFLNNSRPAIPVAGPAGMALMPYQAPVQVASQPQPLTPDQLQKLYNNPYYGPSQAYPQSYHNFTAATAHEHQLRSAALPFHSPAGML